MTDQLETATIRAQMEALDGHTPGPLHIRTLENFGWNIVHYRGGSLHDFLRVAKAALEQDARLIAAAPDMHATILALCEALDAERAENERLRAELAWYGEQSRLARLIHSEGDAGRHALQADGGKRARAALAQKEAE